MDSSSFSFVPVLIGLGVVAFMLVRQRKLVAQQRLDYAQYGLGDVAAKLGMTVVDGNPALNLMLVHQEHQDTKAEGHGGLLGKAMGDSAKETRGRAVGTVWERPYELAYFQRTEVDHGLAQTTTSLWFELSLGAKTRVACPAFEIVMRNPPAYCEPKIKTALPPQSTGNASLDSILVVKTQDPRLAAALVPALIPMMSMGSIHLVGGGDEVRAYGTRVTYMTIVQNAVTFQRALEHIACIIEGRPTSHVDGQAPAQASARPS
ncbi:MAG: hypothetical protein U0230_26820 [Polyangiales bacterium]